MKPVKNMVEPQPASIKFPVSNMTTQATLVLFRSAFEH